MNFCLIGTGVGAAMNAKAIRKISGAKILAVAGSTEKHFNLFAQKYGIPRCYQNTKEMLEKEKPNAVIIASIPTKHWRDILLCKDYCKIIIVEKPIVTDINLIPKIREIVKDNQISLSVVYQHRYDSSYQKLKKLLPSIKDDIYYINLISSDYRRERYYKNFGFWRRTHEKSGGGVLIQHGIHLINFLFSLFNYKYSLIEAKKFYQNGVETESAVLANFLIEEKINCAVFSSRMSPEIKNGIYIYGRTNSYFINENSFLIFKAGKENKIIFKLREYVKNFPVGLNWQRHYHKGRHQDFLRDVVMKNNDTKKESLFLEDALNDIILIHKVYNFNI